MKTPSDPDLALHRLLFERWVDKEFYAGLADVSLDWDEEKQTYKEFSHHMAFCAYRANLNALAAAGELVQAARAITGGYDFVTGQIHAPTSISSLSEKTKALEKACDAYDKIIESRG